MATLMLVRTYDGHLPEDTYLADQTNPWIEIDNVAVGWPLTQLSPAPDNECEQCAGEPLPGVLTRMDSEIGIQRCDTCARFGGDLPAALALAILVGGIVKFEQELKE
jgi:hypothetical protein